MGPNGAGKSTLAHVLAGRDGYDVTRARSPRRRRPAGAHPEERAAAGLFLAFQYPVEIPGVGNMYFLRTAVNAVRKATGLSDDARRADFLELAQGHMAEPSAWTRRS